MKTKTEPESIHILVVDDEVGICDACERILTRMHFEVTTSARGEEALRVLKKKKDIPIVLLDLKMPGMDGLEVLRQIHRFDESILTVVITGYATVEMAIEAMKRGAHDFIPKPLEVDPLRIVVRRAAEQVRLARQAQKLDTERRRTLADLGAEKSRIRTILELLPTAIVVTNASGQVVLMNPAFQRLFDLQADAQIGAAIESCVKDEAFCDYVMKISRGEWENAGEVPSHELVLADDKYLVAKGRPIHGEDKRCSGAVLAISDITTMRMLDRLKSEFVAEVSHELRSPLSTIHEQLALVIDDMSDQNIPEDLKILTRALQKTDGLISLVGDLLDLSRIEAGFGYHDRKLVRLEEVLEGIVDFLSSKALARSQSLTLELPQGHLPQLVCDPFALESILGNLITNAINYTPDGGKVGVAAHLDGEHVCVSVADNGIGIAEKHRDKIFSRFYRVKTAQTRHVAGTGLGLPIVRELLDHMGGSVQVQSVAGKGSTFTVLLPFGQQPTGK